MHAAKTPSSKDDVLAQFVKKALQHPHLISGNDIQLTQDQGWSMQDILQAIKQKSQSQPH